MKKILTIPGFGTRTLHFNSRVARILGGPGNLNNCVSPNATDIYISRGWITAMGLAHEWGHGEDAKRLGGWYIPWVIWGYISTLSHDGSPAEIRADAFMMAHYREFPQWVQP